MYPLIDLHRLESMKYNPLVVKETYRTVVWIGEIESTTHYQAENPGLTETGHYQFISFLAIVFLL